jgi:hypothetical protein
MADDSERAVPTQDPERKMEPQLSLEEHQQPDPALQLSTGRLGAAGWAIFALVGIFILTVVLWGLNGPNEPLPSGAASNTSAATPNTSAPNTSAGPTPTAPGKQTGQ